MATRKSKNETGRMKRSLLSAYLFHILGLCGLLGMHRLYLGRTRSAGWQFGLLFVSCLLMAFGIWPMIFMVYGLMIWGVIDLFLIPGMTRRVNRQAQPPA